MKKNKIIFDKDRYRQGLCKLICGNDSARIINDNIEGEYHLLALVEDQFLKRIYLYNDEGQGINMYSDPTLFLECTDYEKGDYVVDSEGTIFIFKELHKDGVSAVGYIGITENMGINLIQKDIFCRYDSIIRLATDKEIEKLDKELEKRGLKFNFSKNILENIGMGTEFNQYLKTFDKVLVRNDDNDTWKPDLFDSFHFVPICPLQDRFITFRGKFRQCIKYDEFTKCLIDTSNPSPSNYKSWRDKH